MSESVDHVGRMMVIWNFIEAWLQRVTLQSLIYLSPGAEESAFQVVEDALGLLFPADLKASWMLHNGTAPQFLGGWYLLSLQQIVQTAHAMRPFDEWSANWLPIAESEVGLTLCVDLDPGHGQSVGRIICYDPEFGASVVAPDFWHLMSWFVNDLEDGEYNVNAAGHLWSEDVSLGS
jgi:cell wall assembly regulator SMI1